MLRKRYWNAGQVCGLALLGIGFTAPGVVAQCIIGSSSSVTPPVATYLRSVREEGQIPGRMATDESGNLYVTDPYKELILVRNQFGRVISSVAVGSPVSVAVSASKIYVGQKSTRSVLVFDRSWVPLGKLGSGDGEFVSPGDIAVESGPAYPQVYVADGKANQVKVYDANDGSFLFAFGGFGSNAGQLNFPAAVHVSAAGDVYVADQNNNRIQVFDQSGAFQWCFTLKPTDKSFWCSYLKCKGLSRPAGFAEDRTGRLYVTDAFQGEVLAFDDGGVFLGTIGKQGKGPGELATPIGVTIDLHNRLFVASVNGEKLEVFGLDDFTDPQGVEAVVDVKPEKLRRSANNNYATAYIEVPGSSLNEEAAATIKANGVPALASPCAIGDFDGDGVPDLMVKFDAAAVLATLPDGDAVVTVTGQLDGGLWFEGTDTVHVMPETSGQEKKK